MINVPSIAQLRSDWFKLLRSRSRRRYSRHPPVRNSHPPGCLSTSSQRVTASTSSPGAQGSGLRPGSGPERQDLDQRARPTRQGRRLPLLPNIARWTRSSGFDRPSNAVDLICDWLRQTQLFGPAREAIVKEVQRSFRLMKEAGLHPPVVAHPKTPVSEIIERRRAACGQTASISSRGSLSGSPSGPSSPFPTTLSEMLRWI